MTTLERIALSAILVFSSLIYKQGGVEKITVELSPRQEKLTCYSPFDIYETIDYEVTDDNKTLITAYGRVYHREDCR